MRSLRRFAKRLSADYEAVRAAVTLGWSNGPVEESTTPERRCIGESE